MVKVQSMFVWLIVVFLVSVAFSAAKTATDQEKKIDGLIQKLGQRDWQDTVDALVEIGPPAVEPLIRTLKDRSIKTWNIHARTINTLTKIGTPEAVEIVIEILKDTNSNQYVRGFAALAISDLKPKGAVVVLAKTLMDKNQFVRWKSAQALGTLGDQQGAGALIRALKDEDQYVRAAAVKSLHEIKAENAGDALVNAFDDESWLVRLNAREALLQIGEPAFDSLINALKDSNSRIRWQAVWVLGRAKNELAIEPLIELLADPDWMVRDEAAVALVRIGSEKVANLRNRTLKNETDDVRKRVDWILARMKSNKTVEVTQSRNEGASKELPNKIYFGRKVYPCYPEMLNTKPDIPSPHTMPDGTEIVTAFMKNGKYALIMVTVENGKTLDYKQNLWGKGRQLAVDAADFPTMARTGLHSEGELNQTKMITGRSVVEITEIGRPGRSSGAGFMSDDEDILSVLKGDNRFVEALDLKHPQLAKPLFHVWNMILRDNELGRLGRFWNQVDYMLYHDKKVFLKAEGSRGWQESLFDDEILGMFQFDLWRELDQDEKAFLREKYSHQTDHQMTELFRKLSHIHTGEMAPYYIMRYGFYEGHTDYRADPIAIAWIFGLRNIRQIDATCHGKLYEALTEHFTREDE